MIRYDRARWTVLYWEGGIIRDIWRPALIYLCFLLVLFAGQKRYGDAPIRLAHGSLQVTMSFLVFLLVFRVNTNVSANKAASAAFYELFANIEGLVAICCGNLRGASLERIDQQKLDGELALLSKINIIRLTLAWAVSVAIYCSLLDGTYEQDGALDEDSICDIVFCHHRLRGLLFSEELAVLEEACRVTREPPEAPDDSGDAQSPLAQALAAFFESPGTELRNKREAVLIGSQGHGLRGRREKRFTKHSLEATHPQFGNDRFDQVTAPLPNILLYMLQTALVEPLSKPWGYPERMLNVLTLHVDKAMSCMAEVQSMITVPCPMPYVQLSHILILTFGAFYPLSIPVEDGMVECVVMPFLIFFTIQGFETIAKQLELPTGHDVTDLNLMDFIHRLEVHVSYIFESTERHRASLKRALSRPVHQFGFTLDPKDLLDPENDGSGPPHHFSAYFSWMPIPSIILTGLLEAHGHADLLSRIRRIKHRMSLRRLLRRSVGRFHHGRRYDFVDEESETFQEDEAVKAAMDGISQDPLIFTHYLVFTSIHSASHGESASAQRVATDGVDNAHASWKEGVSKMLEEMEATGSQATGNATALLRAVDGEDSVRSVLPTYTKRTDGREVRIPGSHRDYPAL